MVYWFKKHPEYLIKECNDLSHDSNYQELYQKRDERLVSHGYVVTRLEKVEKHPILIIYPPATPYVLPHIFPLNRELSEKEVEFIASRLDAPLPENSIKYFYHYRHQNGTGLLCFLEWESFDDGGEFYGITSILQRVCDWYKAHTTNDFPLDNEEVAFSAHFTNLNTNLYFLYPEAFVSSGHIQGSFIASQFFDLPKNTGHPSAHYYLGSYITGIKSSGLVEEVPRKLSVTTYLKSQGLITSLDLDTKPDLVQRLMKENALKQGTWFDLQDEPAPFESFRELVTIIGNGDFSAGQVRLTQTSFEQMKPLPDEFLIGIRFPNRKGRKEFQLFTVKKVAQPNGLPLFCAENETMAVLVSNYDRVEAIQCEKLSEETFFQRNAKRAEHNRLKEVVANILGVGALGSEIADCLAKGGVGELVLVDPQVMTAHNILRHLAGGRFIGLEKVYATKEYLEEHNPFIEVLPLPASVTAFDVATTLSEKSVTVSAIADDNIENYVNEELVAVNKTAFYVRALRGGKAARIVRVIPGEDACLNCLRLYRQDANDFVKIPADLEIPVLRTECNNPILPASAADLKLIAGLCSRIVLDELQGLKSKTNHWVWSSEKLDGTPFDQPFVVKQQSFKPHHQCQFCSDGEPTPVSIEPDVLSFMAESVRAKAGIETGGVLAGYYDENGTIHIRYASSAGPYAKETATGFEKDIEFCQRFLDDLLEMHGDRAVYLGEWHSHPDENNTPSNMDLQSLSGIAYQKEYLTDTPIMIVFTKSGVPSCTIHPVGKIYKQIELNILSSAI